ncbi:MAG: 4,5-DOPA dioxygenase extradiol [Deltaproteobacteria bacterium]|nr:4,5-DOPA dioxygenase extradiol [Deltaproteobacteria bacterium]
MTEAPSPLAPAAFIGHGSPMNTLEDNRFTRAWRAFGATVPRPRAVLVVSAHWYVGVTAVTAMARPRTIHDFFGFPAALETFEYPAPGAPDVAAEVAEAVKPQWCGLDQDAWGLDHGAWSVLAHVFPKADVPVVQLSLNATKDDAYHLELATKLAPLRARGILVLGSGNVVHNLRRLEWRRPDAAADWAVRFDEAAREIVTTRPAEVSRLREHPDFALAVPTPDHFLPLLYLAGLAAAANTGADVIVDGYFAGSLSMTSYSIGTPCA